MLCWLHVGDLHITGPDEGNLRALHEIVAQANHGFSTGVDFVFLPGDNANEGTAAEYQLIRTVLDELTLPVRILAGDHDFETGSLEPLHAGLRAPAAPIAETIAGHRCVFLDIVSAGSGGPDFRLGAEQQTWLERELAAIPNEPAARGAALFMHAYPRELRDCGEAVAELVARSRIAIVAMGHTHYNELANDGTTIYSTVRSTGQVEEGPPGFALTAIDGSVVSWRFKSLHQPFPFCLITSPADEQLLTDRAQISCGALNIRARIWSDIAIDRAIVQIDSGPERPMCFDLDGNVWTASINAPPGRHDLIVLAIDVDGRTDLDRISVYVGDPTTWSEPERQPPGSDANALGAWQAKGIHGGQLGPNKNGRKW